MYTIFFNFIFTVNIIIIVKNSENYLIEYEDDSEKK